MHVHPVIYNNAFAKPRVRRTPHDSGNITFPVRALIAAQARFGSAGILRTRGIGASRALMPLRIGVVVVFMCVFPCRIRLCVQALWDSSNNHCLYKNARHSTAHRSCLYQARTTQVEALGVGCGCGCERLLILELRKDKYIHRRIQLQRRQAYFLFANSHRRRPEPETQPFL